jgi:hypothetical protein
MPRIYTKKNSHEVRHGNSKMDAAVIAKLELAFAGGHSDAEACLIAGINQRTLTRYEDKNPEFAEKKELLKNTPILKARQTLNKAIETNADIAFKFLERKKRDEFGVKTEVDVTSLGGRVVSFNYLPPIGIEGEIVSESNTETHSQATPSIPETTGQDY